MTQVEFNRAIRTIERQFKRQAIEQVREHWRKERGLIYVKTYTVAAHLRRVKPRAH